MKISRPRAFVRGSALIALIPLLAGLVSPAQAAVTVTPIAGAPTIGTQPNNGAITTLDVERLGYDASEFIVDGTAHSYHTVGGVPLTSNGEWALEADAAPTPAFRTRVQVLKPKDHTKFNGTVYVEWLNVTSGRDAAPEWFLARVELARQGAVFIGVSAQAIGLNTAKAAFPDRYGSLVHPGDSYSYDIFSQAGQAVREHAAELLGSDFPVDRVIALGESQSAGRMVTYVNGFATLSGHGVYDGYLIHSRSANSAALRSGVAALPVIGTPALTLIRTDLAVPVFVIQGENDSRAARQADSDLFRWWEPTGTSHVDLYTAHPLVAEQDDGKSSAPAEALFNAMLYPLNNPRPGLVPACTYGLNAGPMVWIVRAAFRHMNKWVANGTLPPSAPRLATVDGTATGALVLDVHGNAIGGVRSPHVDVPVATLSGTGNTPGFSCALFGSTIEFSPAKLAQLYKSHSVFVLKWSQSLSAGVRAGYFLPEDAKVVLLSAVKSDVGTRTGPQWWWAPAPVN